MTALSPTWFADPCILGIDEAGRGPVLGDMVYGCAFCSRQEGPALASRGFADSKKLTEARRAQLFAQIQADSAMGWDTESLTAAYISQKMLSWDKVSLNVLANEATLALIDRVLARGMDVREAYIDTVGDPRRHERMLSSRYPSIKFVVCPKADSIYPIVSAASIAAKVTRDTGLQQAVHEGAGQPGARAYGSGYPGDPVTKAWMEAHLDPVFGFPGIVRFSWQTCTRLLDERAIPVRWECEEAEQEGQRALAFAGAGHSNKQTSSGAGRHSFFRARQLQAMQTF